MDTHGAILDELSRAAERLGGDGERIRALHLVLKSLGRWNRGEPPFDYLIATTGGR